MSFIFGGNTGLTYEQAKRQREIAQQLAARPKRPETFGQGLSAIGEALAARGMRKRADEVIGKKKSEADDLWGSVFGQRYGGAPTGQPRGTDFNTAPTRNDALAANGGPTIAAAEAANTGSLVGGEAGTRIRGKLIERGLPEHVADAFVVNMRDESGLDPSINERNPVVPGSRGGFGLYQLTGPRRNQYEEFAAARGADPSSEDAQLDFLMWELQNTEKGAAEGILSAPDTATAATAIVNDFLRPAEEHRTRRAQRYSSLGGGQPRTSAQGQPPQGQPVGTADAGQARLQQLYGLLSNPVIANDPTKSRIVAMEIERLQKQNAPQKPNMKFIPGYGLVDMNNPPRELMAGNFEPQPEMTSGMREYEFARQQGYKGTFQDYKRDMAQAGAPSVSTTVNTGDQPDTRPMADKPAKGFQRRWDPERGTWVDEPIPGSGVDAERGEAADKKAERERQRKIKMGPTLTNLQMNINEIEDGGFPVTGPVGAVAGAIPGTPASDWRVRNAQITTEGALAEVQRMRDNSPTGGAVGQLTDSEREAIALAATGMSNAQSSEEYVRAAKAYRKTLLDIALKDPSGGVLPYEVDEQGNVLLDGQVWFEFGPGEGQAEQPAQGGEMTFEQFSQDPSAQAAADRYGVTLEEMWDIKRGMQ